MSINDHNLKDLLERTIVETTDAINRNPNDADAYYERGVARFRDHEAALADFTEAIRLKPDFAKAYLMRASHRKGQKDIEGAIADYSQVIRLKPDDAEAYRFRADSYYSLGRLDDAIADYSQVIRLKPDDGAAYLRRGDYLRQKGDLTSALADYTASIQHLAEAEIEDDSDVDEITRRTTIEDAYAARARIRYEQGDLIGTIEDYSEAIRLLALYGSFGEVDVDDWDETNLQAKLKIIARHAGSFNATYHYGRAKAYDLLGDKNRACYEFRLANQRDWREPMQSEIRKYITENCE